MLTHTGRHTAPQLDAQDRQLQSGPNASVPGSSEGAEAGLLDAWGCVRQVAAHIVSVKPQQVSQP